MLVQNRSSNASAVHNVNTDTGSVVERISGTVLRRTDLHTDTNPYSKAGLELLSVDISGGPGWYRFTIIPELRLSANGSLKVRHGWNGRGIGPMLVEARERICDALDIETIVIGANSNDTFWTHLGYEPVREHEYYVHLSQAGIIRYELRTGFSTPRMKRL